MGCSPPFVLITNGVHSMDTTYRNSCNHDNSRSTNHDIRSSSQNHDNDDACVDSDVDQDNMDT
jgi:hypothetical protein